MISPELTYLLKVNLALILFYAFYRLFCTRDTFFRWRRFTLLAFWLMAWLYPLMNVQNWINEQAPMQEAVLYAQTIYSETFVAAPGPDTFSIFSKEMLAIIYFAGVALLGIRFLIQLFIIFRLSRQCRKFRINSTSVRLLKKKSGPFSFFGWIFLHPDTLENTQETEEILAHELTHAREWHSVDTLLSELNCIVCWINPFSWLLKREIRNNLEYLADHHVVAAGHDTKTYQYHLLGLAHQKAAATLYNNFNVLPIKKRIMMMNKKRTKEIGRTKYFLFLPLAAMLMILSNIEAVGRSTQNVYSKITETLSTVSPEEPSGLPSGSTEKTAKKTTEKPPLIVLDGKIISKKLPFDPATGTNQEYADFLNISADEIKEIMVLKGEEAIAAYGKKGRNGVLVFKTKNSEQSGQSQITPSAPHTEDQVEIRVRTENQIRNNASDAPQSNSKDEDPEKPHSGVEQQPQFKGGEKALYEYLSNHLTYPQKAQEAGIQGKVFIRMVIEKDGSITEVEVMKSLSPETDAEAVRAVKAMPKWEPGKQKGKAVRCYFVLPISFKLS